MADIALSSITIPPYEPYDEKHEHRQRENFFYVALQILDQAKQQGAVIPDKAGLQDIFDNVNISVNIASLDGIETAIKDLKFNSVAFTLGNAQFVFDGKTLTHLTS